MEAKKVYHLVHIGYDPWEHPNFEEKMKNLILGISWKTHEILSFVDVPDFTIEHFTTQARRIMDLDLLMGDYFAVLFNIYFFRNFWTKINQNVLEKKLSMIPFAIKDFLRDHFDIPDIHENDLLVWLSENDFQKIRTLIGYWPDKRLDILKRARRKFLPNNPQVYPLDGKIIHENTWRRERIKEYAIDLLWPRRVQVTYMPDLWFYREDNSSRINQDESAYHVYNSYLVGSLVFERFQWLMSTHDKPYRDNWWEITQNTSHVVVGEYRGSCVSCFAHVAKRTLSYEIVDTYEEYTLQKNE